METNEILVELAQALADPLRLVLLQRLMEGPATVSELMAVTGEAQSKLSNHLAVLRERELVRSQREGRQMVYSLRDASVAQLIEALSSIAGKVPPKIWKSPQLVEARTCYDHLAGRYGVAVLDALIARSALQLTTTPHAEIQPGPRFQETFTELGIDPAAVRRERRRFALACLDWTERRPHLGGALGAALWAQFVKHGWIVKQQGTRAVIVTREGQAWLQKHLGVSIGDIG
ncbi:ArsR/SmtB family transcription factor [Dictyobacter formicarum]|uniref:Transcriptional regulator n=1 Tax=Dictyobacter formicarum TaxID=2778368 RepID=A0ABQ3VJB7_9CHLR|nr:metalloregulator ArsR/SmtB family transcription factor [Dictyobacter formicarum]GHO85779.1 transcriptional regulator [Dictyobacter formicarum]